MQTLPETNEKVSRVIIAGGRNFSDYTLLKLKCDKILHNLSNITIISGKARGADQLGERYAKDKGYRCEGYPADWDTFGKRAGYIRNKEMAQTGTHLIAFWDGKSPGTKSMIELAHQHGLKVRVIKYV